MFSLKKALAGGIATLGVTATLLAGELCGKVGDDGMR